jgi:hypothetical protein
VLIGEKFMSEGKNFFQLLKTLDEIISGKENSTLPKPMEIPPEERSLLEKARRQKGKRIQDESIKQEVVEVKSYTNTKEKPTEKLKVFLCHSSSDKLVVEKIYSVLKKDGIEPWLDKINLIPGQEWQIEIPKAVENAHVVIVFLSSETVNKEGYVQKEIRIALDVAEEKPTGTIFIIPAKLEECEVPYRLSKYQWVDLFKKDGYEKLLKALELRASSLNIYINRVI